MIIENIKEISKAFGNIIQKSSTMPILQCIKITVKGSKITFAGTNLQQTIKYTIDNLNNENDAEMAINFQEFKKLPEGVDVTREGDKLVARKGKTKIELSLSDNTLFPIIPDKGIGGGFNLILTDEIRLTIKTVVLASQKGTLNSVFSGVKIGTEIVATDSKRIYVGKGFAEGDVTNDDNIQEWVIPSIVVPFLDQFDELTINNQNAIFSSENWELRTHLLSTKFPDHNKVFPKELPDWFKITDEVVNGIKLAGGYIPSDSFKIMLETRGNVLVIETGDSEVAFTTEVEIEGYTDKRMAFNQKFFLELCEIFNGETLKAGDFKNPITINNNSLRGLLMPLRVTR